MSRCFPYPPPGYTLSRASNEALIESIKKREKSKEQKEKRKEKKEKKQEKEKKKNEKKQKVDQKFPNSDTGKSQNAKKIFADTKAQFHLKAKESETEQLERSSLSEEHGLPVCLAAVPSTSSDSTENTNKRKRDSSPLDGSRGTGSIIRIRLSKKQKSDAQTNEQLLFSNSIKPDFPAQSKDVNGLGHGRDFHTTLNRTPNVVQQLTPKIGNKEQICSTSQPAEAVAPVKNSRDSHITLNRTINNGPQIAGKIYGKEKICSSSQPAVAVAPVKNRRDFHSNLNRTTNVGQQLAPKTDNKEQICSTSQPAAVVAPVKKGSDFYSTLNRTTNVSQQFARKICDEEQICSTSKPVGAVAPVKPPRFPSVPNPVMTKMHKKELLYKNLFENWSPPPLQNACLDPPDLDWLLKGWKSGSSVEKKAKNGAEQISCLNSFALQPRAIYLKEADIYALPYTVPF